MADKIKSSYKFSKSFYDACINSAEREQARPKVKTMQGDVGALPFEEGSFDYVLCMNGLHVFPNKDKACSEILRTLKPGGELLACFYIAGVSGCMG